MGIPALPYSAFLLAAWQGNDAELSGLIKTSVDEAEARGEGNAPAVSELALAILYNGLGRYHAALSAVREVGERPYEIGAPTLGCG